MEYTVGQVVYSKGGHDKGDIQIIISIEGEYVYLVDGKRRTLNKPKRKKIKHIQPTWTVFESLSKKLLDKEYLLDADIVKAIKEYREKEGSK